MKRMGKGERSDLDSSWKYTVKRIRIAEKKSTLKVETRQKGVYSEEKGDRRKKGDLGFIKEVHSEETGKRRVKK